LFNTVILLKVVVEKLFVQKNSRTLDPEIDPANTKIV